MGFIILILISTIIIWYLIAVIGVIIYLFIGLVMLLLSPKLWLILFIGLLLSMLM